MLNAILDKYRQGSFSQRDKGARFERLMRAYLLTDPRYAPLFSEVWLWGEFPGRHQFGRGDTGIDLVALSREGDYWAIQCKCYHPGSSIDKASVDSFLSTSSRSFRTDGQQERHFSQRLWISTTNNWSSTASEAFKNQNPPVTRLNLSDLEQAPVDWEKLERGVHGPGSRRARKLPAPHQKEAVNRAQEYFRRHDRGKLIMACGTGKTFTSLLIAENETGPRGLVLFLVPSIALLGQTLREWTADARKPLRVICVCSDAEVSKSRVKQQDKNSFSSIDLALPASTRPGEIIRRLEQVRAEQELCVVLSTYQSLDVIAQAQKQLLEKTPDLYEFDLVICDEAHRTTGISLSGEEGSAFTKVHEQAFIRAKKRLYMTATPRLYSEDVKTKAAETEAVLCSMDDKTLYGEEIYRIGFGEAVKKGLLTDYKVLILTLNEHDVPAAIQEMLSDQEKEIHTDDISRLIGCVNALSKQILGDDGIIQASDPSPMRRAVAFCGNITASKKISAAYNTATDAYLSLLPPGQKDRMIPVSARHIDGAMPAPQRDELLHWLKEEDHSGQCRVLSNVRCLSEGIDVPSLDAVMFLSPRHSQIDVVQAVGRVMRKSPGKKFGYIIIPIVVPYGIEADIALDHNEHYKVVWSVLNALKAHDDRFEATVNTIELNHKRPEQILVGRPGYSFDGEETLDLVTEGLAPYGRLKDVERQMAIRFEDLQQVIFARLVRKVGSARYWEQWVASVADIAEKQTRRITLLVEEDAKHREAFNAFLISLQKNLNPSTTEGEVIEMLAQHIITKPVFEALFDGYSFVKQNPISRAMQHMLDLLEEQSLEKDLEVLHRFYDSVRLRAEKIDNAAGRQKIIIELYDTFFKKAFPRLVERLGIVYTPVEVVDFIIHSVNDILRKEFGQSLGDKDVHILDPFTGTGTFMTRLLQSGLIPEKDLARKYRQELHANELVLLAYYIATINIEHTYHELSREGSYSDFRGICLTDTFQLGEGGDSEGMFSDMFPQNSDRVTLQKKQRIRVILGNPPYSIGQRSANDNARNQAYPRLDEKIASTYARESSAGLNKSLYDAYIKAFRWSTDRLDPESGGLICFVSNGAWVEGHSTDGFRKQLEKEFSSIYVFNLRGNQRTSGELSRKEGGKIFGSGARTPIAVTLLVKKPEPEGRKARIYYHDIGEYLSREEKLSRIRELSSAGSHGMRWEHIQPDQPGDWLHAKNEQFGTFLPLAAEKKFSTGGDSVFCMHAIGINSGRDAWVYNYSSDKLLDNMGRMIAFYNDQQFAFSNRYNPARKPSDSFIDGNPQKIKWTVNLKRDLEKGVIHKLYGQPVTCLYRPFNKMHLYFEKAFIERPGLNKMLFPDRQTENLVICLSGAGSSKDFSVLMSNCLFSLDMLEKSQGFPLFFYEPGKQYAPGIFDSSPHSRHIRSEGISDLILERANRLYKELRKPLSRDDLFFYVYGFLHSPGYRQRFRTDLKRSLPRIPLPASPADFMSFRRAGRELAWLHVDYESIPAPPEVRVVISDPAPHYRVSKMRFPGKGRKDTIIYNQTIRLEQIPLQAYDYVLNGKSAIEWVMDRYQVSRHKDSGIVNDPNDWAEESGNPRYILDLLLSVISVSLRTTEIVSGLPEPEV